MSTAVAHRGLSEEQVAQFHNEGFLVVENVFDDARLDAVADEVTQVIDREATRLVAEGKLSQTYLDRPFTSRLTYITQETEAVFKSILAGRLALASIFELIRTPALLDIAESLCGPELIASSVYRLRPKLPNFPFGEVPWHQDSGYFEPYCDSALVLTCWIPLVDATPENGCLQVIKGAHHGPVVQHEQKPWYLEIPPEHLPRGEVVTAPVPRGGVLLLTNRTPHQSTPNTTDTIRWSMDVRYQSASLPTNAPITRLPDETMEEAAPVACYPPEADFLVRSRLRPNEVLQSAQAFEALRLSHSGGALTKRW